ncbi:MAG: DNA repair protein RecO [Acidobacteriota bacterium]
MLLKRSDAFVLKSMKYGESDRIVTFYSRNFGKITGIARGAAKSRRRFGGLLEPLTEVAVTYMEKEGKELSRIDSCDLVTSHVQVQEDIKVYYAFAYMAEMIDQFSTCSEEDERFYRLIKSVIEAIEGGIDLAICIRYFEIWTLKLQGILPGIRDCSSCGREIIKAGGEFSPTSCDILCFSCGKSLDEKKISMKAETLEFISQVSKKRVEDLNQQALLKKEFDSRLEEFLHTLFMNFSEKQFKSYRYFKECLRELKE